MARPNTSTSGTPAPPPLEGHQLMELELGGWNRKVAIPNDLLSPLLAILDKCHTVEHSYMTGNAYVQTMHGRPAVTTSPACRASFALVPAEDKDEYVSAYNATHEVCKGTPVASLPLVLTYEQFRAKEQP